MKKRGDIFFYTLFSAVSIVAGVVNGLLGAGGGVLLLYLFRWALRREAAGGEKSEHTRRGDRDKDAFASVVATVLPLSVVSSVTYALGGRLDTAQLRVLIVPALLGGFLGAILTEKLPAGVIRGVFAVLVTVSGVRMVFF